MRVQNSTGTKERREVITDVKTTDKHRARPGTSDHMNGILVVDDEQGYLDEMHEFLTDCGFPVLTALSPFDALSLLEKRRIDIAILDLRLPGMNGIELLKKIHSQDPEIAVIMISGHGQIDSVIEAMRAGAVDFIPKPFNLDDIRIAIERTRKFRELQDRLQQTQSAMDYLKTLLEREGRPPIIGDSQAIRTVVGQMRKVSACPGVDVLVTGESGTGKELVARGIHHLDEDARGVFYDINCTAIPETLFESEFFGHEKNAFTGAGDQRRGCFEIAEGGTLFLDEIGDMPPPMQAKLLRALEERRIRRLGSSLDIPLHLRVIASTNRDLAQLIRKGAFREDLYHRLNRFSIHIPPLRERKDDIAPLLAFFSARIAREMKRPVLQPDSKLLARLAAFPYHGNVRELKNMVEKAYILTDATTKRMEIQHFPDLGEPPGDPDDTSGLNLGKLETREQEMIRRALSLAGGNKTKAAEMLGITRTSLNRRLKRYGMMGR